MTDMHPMSTAPRDGTPILLYGGEPDDHHDQHHFLDAPKQTVVVGWWDDDVAQSWRFTSYDSGHYGLWLDPDGWRPLQGTNDAAQAAEIARLRAALECAHEFLSHHSVPGREPINSINCSRTKGDRGYFTATFRSMLRQAAADIEKALKEGEE